MANAQKFLYSSSETIIGTTNLMPYLPLTLERSGVKSDVMCLLDSGATVNVLPYNIGRELGAVWEQQTTVIELGGNLAQSEARRIILDATVAGLPPIRLAFAWTQSDDVPLILGQVNFFFEFDVCFYRSQMMFEVKSKR